MKRMLFNATYQEELRVASVEGQKLINFDIETSSKTQRRGNIYCGIITRVEASLEACFVDYGTDKQGFLPFKEIDPVYLSETARFREYSKLTEGTKLIIQVEKDERGNKGAALTTYISLPGRYLVLMPNNSRSGGISRRIEGEERDELKAVLSNLTFPSGMSVIARTAALGRVTEELQWDLNYLLKLWNAITNAAAHHDRFLIYQESNLVIRSIRDHFSPDVSEILIDEETIYNEARNFMASIMPHYVEKIKFYHDDVQLFSRFQIEHQIESAYSRVVHLPSGGSIVVDHTEALTAIDVNSAKANKGVDIEATALATNLEASEEIARQLRLRDLGGLIVVDFIDMENQRNQRDVENCFKQQLGYDRARIQMGKLSRFGLLELSRQRLQASLEESTTISCPRCAGTGVIRGTESIAVHILRIIQEEVVKNSHQLAALHVQLPVEVATYLLNEKRDDVAKIENRMRVRILLIPNIHLDSPHYKIKKFSSESYETISKKQSFNLVDTFEDSQNVYLEAEKKASVQPQKAAVRNVLPTQPIPVTAPSRKSFLGGVIGKVMHLFKNNFVNKRNGSLNGAKAGVAKKVNPTVAKFDAKAPQSNKMRPVTVNKSNTKIQTVRPTNSGNTNHRAANNNVRINVASEVVKEAATTANIKKPVAPKAMTNENRAKPQNPLSRTRVQNTDSLLNSNVVDTKPPAQAKKSSPVNIKPNSDTRSINNEYSDLAKAKPIKQNSSLGNNISINSDIQPKQVIKQPFVPLETTASEAKEMPDAIKANIRNTILDSVDLGKLELVTTNHELSKQNQDINNVTIADKHVKRHNDIVNNEIDLVKIEVNYELIETKPGK